MTRRELLAAVAAAPLLASQARATPEKALLGGSPTAFSVRVRAAKRNNEVFDIVEHCHQLGLSGAESGLLNPTPEAIKAMHHKIDSYGMTVVLNVPLPKTEADLATDERSEKHINLDHAQQSGPC